MSFEKTRWVWQNGEFLRWDEAKIHSSAFGLHYGVGVFEGLRCYETAEGSAVFRLKEHMDRLYASAQVYQLGIPYSQEELNEAICETIRRNDFTNCYIRPTAYFDSGSLGIRAVCPVGVNILTWEWPNDFGAEKLAKGMRVTVSPYKKFHSSMIPTTAKATGNYLNSIIARGLRRGRDHARMEFFVRRDRDAHPFGEFLGAEIVRPFPGQDVDADRTDGADAQAAAVEIGRRANVAVCEIIPSNRFADRLVQFLLRVRDAELINLRRRVEPIHVFFQPEDGRAFSRFITAKAFKDAHAVMKPEGG